MRLSNFIVCLLALLLCAGALSAQYLRTAGTSTYTPRSGNGVNARWLSENQFDDNCRIVNLPFAFTYFDRSYNTVYFSTNGRLAFSNANATEFLDPAITATAPANMRDCIHVIAGDLWADHADFPSVMRVFFESGRVVFQWSGISFLGDSGYQRVSFQVHLLQNNNIEFHFGGATTTSPALTEFVNYVSGLVDNTGTQVAAGFGNVLTQQTTFPAANADVTFTPTSTAGNGINLHSRDPHSVQRVVGVENDAVIDAFRLTPYGTGGTVSQIVFSARLQTNVVATYRLVVDTAPLGVYNGEATIGSAAQVTNTVTISGLSEALTATPKDYLILANVTAINNTDGETQQVAAPNVMASAPVWGGYFSSQITYTTGSIAFSVFSEAITSFAPAASGTNNAVLASLEARVVQGTPNMSLNALDFQFTYNGAVTDATFSALRLWVDRGARGVLDSNDILLNTQTPLTTGIVSFSPFPLTVLTTSGTDFLVTADIAPGFAGMGAVSMDLDSYSSLDPNDLLSSFSASNPVAIVGTGAGVYLNLNSTNFLFTWPVQPSDTNLVGLALTARTTTGAGSITALTFTNTAGGALAGVTNSRLLLDNGTLAGRLDAGDTPLTATVTPAGTNIAFTGISGLTLGTTPVNILFVFDLNGSATADYQFSVSSGTSTPATSFSLPTTLQGTFYQVGTGVGNSGIDVTIDSLDPGNANFGGGELAFIGRFTATARGLGGSLPSAVFTFQNSAGGVGDQGGLQALVYVEGAGPTGKVDGSDTLNAFQFSPDDVRFAANNVPLSTGSLSFLVFLRRDQLFFPIDGTGQLVLRGFANGTNVRVFGGLAAFNGKNLTVQNGKVGGGKSSDGGGCTADASDTRLNLAMLAGVLGVMLVGLRTKMRRA